MKAPGRHGAYILGRTPGLNARPSLENGDRPRRRASLSKRTRRLELRRERAKRAGIQRRLCHILVAASFRVRSRRCWGFSHLGVAVGVISKHSHNLFKGLRTRREHGAARPAPPPPKRREHGGGTLSGRRSPRRETPSHLSSSINPSATTSLLPANTLALGGALLRVCALCK